MLLEIIEDTTKGMENSLHSLDVAFKKIRTGRATASLLDSIRVDYYEKPTPLSQVASISIEDAKTLAIVPWEKGVSQGIERAISESDLGLNPSVAGETIRVILPDLTEETRRDFIKKAKLIISNYEDLSQLRKTLRKKAL